MKTVLFGLALFLLFTPSPTRAAVIIYIDPTAGNSSEALFTAVGSHTVTLSSAISSFNGDANWYREPTTSAWIAPTFGWDTNLTPGFSPSHAATAISGPGFTQTIVGPGVNQSRSWSGVYANGNAFTPYNASQANYTGLAAGTYEFTLSGSGLYNVGIADNQWAAPGTESTFVYINLHPDVTLRSIIGSVPDTPAVPEPSSLALFGMGAIGLFGYGRRKRKQAA